MFSLLYTNRIKCLLRDKALVFWTLLFPLILATLFHFAFSNILSDHNFKAIPVAVIENEDYQKSGSFKETMKAVSGILPETPRARYSSRWEIPRLSVLPWWRIRYRPF